jgi:hypothetical protein
MNREELYLVAEDAANESELCGKDIPAIDLYVDQIINLVQAKLEQGSTRYRENRLTKTMINNYSKDGIITPVKGKKYNKEQILQMLTVYSLKNNISIGEIKRLLDGAYSIEGFDGSSLESLYDRHLSIKQDNRDYGKALLDELIDKNALDVSDDVDYIVTVCALVSLSSQLRNIAKAMIDAKYPEPVESEEEETDKEAKKKEKKERKEEKKEEKKDKKEKKKKESSDDLSE